MGPRSGCLSGRQQHVAGATRSARDLSCSRQSLAHERAHDRMAKAWPTQQDHWPVPAWSSEPLRAIASLPDGHTPSESSSRNVTPRSRETCFDRRNKSSAISMVVFIWEAMSADIRPVNQGNGHVVSKACRPSGSADPRRLPVVASGSLGVATSALPAATPYSPPWQGHSRHVRRRQDLLRDRPAVQNEEVTAHSFGRGSATAALRSGRNARLTCFPFRCPRPGCSVR